MKLTPKLITGILVSLLVIGAGALAFNYFNANDAEQSASDTSNQAETTDEGASFNPQGMEGVSFVATINGTTEDGEINATMEHDGQGSTRLEMTQAGRDFELTLTPDAVYSCESETCIRFDTDQASGAAFLDPSEYTYDDEEFDDFRDDANYLGQESCPAGTCDVWEIEDDETIARMYLDTSTSRISQVTSDGPDSEITVVYDYRDVTITPPENVQELPSFNQ